MEDVTLACPKCGGMMEPGFIGDHYTALSLLDAQWIKGTPELSAWTGRKIAGKKRIRVVTFRCVGCGFLESYAPD